MNETSQNDNHVPFPQEVLMLIIKRLRKPDLKRVCLVCKLTRQLAIPLLFDQIAFSPSCRALNLAHRTAAHFGHHVKTLFYFPVRYRHLTLNQFSDISHHIRNDDMIEGCIRQDIEGGHIDDQSLQQHIEHSYRSYTNREREQFHFDQSGAHFVRLCHILSKIPRAEKLVIGATGSSKHIELRDMRHLGISFRDLCPRDDCILALGAHINMQPVPYCFPTPNISDVFHPALQALEVTRSSINQLDVRVHKPKDDSSSLLAVHAFNIRIPQSQFLINRLLTMTKLRFELAINPRYPIDREVFKRGDVAKALGNALNLECLYISLQYNFDDLVQDEDAPQTFEGILGGCQFPALKSLVLECFQPDQDEFLDLLEASPKLEAIYLHDIHLLSGTWDEVAEEMRLMLHLKEMEFSSLRHNDWLGFHYDARDDCIKEVEDFFLRQGTNPFTAKAIETKKALYEANGEPFLSGARGHWSLERYWRRVMG